MAEAHQAVAFSFSITHEGVHINYDTEVLNIVWISGIRSYKKRFFGFINNFKNEVFPSSIEYILSILLIVSTLHLLFKIDTSFGMINLLQEYLVSPLSFHLSKSHPIGIEFLSNLLWGVILCFLKALTMRYFLKILLMYKGWMYESRSVKGLSWKTKIWYPLIKIMTRKQTQLYSYQASLPRLPLPSVHDTIKRYLRSIKPLSKNKQDYERIEKLAYEFENGIAKKLQRYLILKSWWSSNYVSDWWEEFVYLRSRQPLMINSNFYGIDSLLLQTSTRPASRAANIIYACLLFRRAIDRQDLKPALFQGLVPLCTRQYERLFNTTRIPCKESDKLVHFSDSQHIIVLCNGKYFKLDIYFKGKLLTPKQLEKNLEKILSDDSEIGLEKYLASFTALDRIKWANIRETYFRKGINRISLDIIEKAAFILVFDDENFEYDKDVPINLDKYCQALLHGNGCNRWFDKSFNIVVGKNGKIGFNAEHSWADAPIIAHLWEFVLATEIQKLQYNSDGSCAFGELDKNIIIPNAYKLKWDFNNDEIKNLFFNSIENTKNLINDLDLKLLCFDCYGKGFMKKCKTSPDAYIQLALQLAYYRDSDKNFCLTYEASMTRLYREGRTETVRPVTVESTEWVKIMDNENVSNEHKIELFRKACLQHQKNYQDAMCGKGIDRHLFCLYVISKYLEIDSLFLKEVLSEPWKLSTSQTPLGQSGLIDLRKHPEFISAGGGFGPVADDGYGVSYIISGEDFYIFSYKFKKKFR